MWDWSRQNANNRWLRVNTHLGLNGGIRLGYGREGVKETRKVWEYVIIS